MIKIIIIIIFIIILLVISFSFLNINFLKEKIKTVKEVKEITIGNLNNEKMYLIRKYNSEMNELKIKKEKEITDFISKKAKEINDLILIKNDLFKKNKFYTLEIKNKSEDISALSSTLNDIENTVGIKNGKKYSLIKRAKLIKITFSEKQYTLRLIPNGKPLKKIFYTDKFGDRKHPIKKRRIFHKGVDLRAKMKTPVFATADGIVKYAQSKDRGGFGRNITISHNYGFETVYGHLNKLNVKVGDVVRKGDIIALSGNSGRSTGAHLHYEVKYAGKVLNPENFIKWNMRNYDIIFKKERRLKWDSLIDLINQHKKNQVQQ